MLRRREYERRLRENHIQNRDLGRDVHTEGPSWQNEREIGAFMASEVAIEFGGRALKSLNDKVRELGA